MQLKEKISGWLGRPRAYFSGEWNRMAPRERRLVAALAGVVATVAVIVTGLLIFDSLSDIAESNEETREALAVIAKRRDEYLEAKQRMMAQDVRIGTEPPQLLADLEAAAREAGCQLSETSPRPAQPAGKRFMEHNVDVTMRQVDLRQLATFLSKIETGRRLIVVTHMRVQRGYSDGEKLNVSLRATAFERLKDTKKAPTPARRKT